MREKEEDMIDKPRLIEHAFPLKQASLDSVHEKNVRHGHISTLHIWPARRPLAACRAALIATLLPDPSAQPKPEGMSDDAWHEEIIRRRRELCEKIGGKLVKRIERKKMPNGETVEREKEQTVGGILHWGRETENKDTLEWFRQEIKKAYGGRAPKVLDPFAGGGAIPLEAMRLGCEATAVDINPVAWFILKCTLEYPQRLAGKTHPLPDFILKDEEFMDAFYKAHPHLVGRAKPTKKQLTEQENMLPGLALHRDDNTRAPKADIAWHVRAWGRWVLDRARRELARFYPTYADFEALDKRSPRPFEKRPMQLMPLKDDGTPDVAAFNEEFSKEYLADKRNLRWVAKPTVAYLWARTVKCKNCRATLPLLKTRWLCKKDKKRVLLAMEPNSQKTGVVFSIETNVPVKGGNAAQRREHDKRLAGGTMSRSGAKCPCCGTIMTMEDIRLEGKAGRLAAIMTAVVVDGQNGKEYRLPTEHEIHQAEVAKESLGEVFAQIPFGMPEEPLPSAEALGFRVPLYGFDKWKKLFTLRQLLALGMFVKWTREAGKEQDSYSAEWHEALGAYSTCIISRTADYMAQLCVWESGAEEVKHLFMRWALPITWDFAEANPFTCSERFFAGGIQSASRVLSNLHEGSWSATVKPKVINRSAIVEGNDTYDLVFTDPPYYDAIPYSDLMDFFYLWLRRSIADAAPEFAVNFKNPLSPKWDDKAHDGELIDDSSRHGGDNEASRRTYEDGMFRAFRAAYNRTSPNGHLIVVFANKKPDAWETLAAAVIRAGFCVNSSWPIATEMPGGLRNLGRASLSSSVWLVCKKRPEIARPGWDNKVLEDMRRNIREKLREFWDAGIRGPDFVWAATGPAMEAYSKHPVVKKANEPGPMTVSEFLTHVRRMVVDFVVGRVLSGDKEGDADTAAADRLDEPTAYYLLHRHDFGMDEAPAGACILYAISCGVSDRELSDTWNIIGFTKGNKAEEDEAEDADADAESDTQTENDSGSKVRLKTWAQRKGKSLGYEAPGGKPIPLIDRVHCLMHLWKTGDLSKVDGYLDGNGLRRQELFKRLLQSLIELSPHGSEERSLLESLSNHVGAKGAKLPELFSAASITDTEHFGEDT
jgi:adenine-specific DNA methylase